LIIRSLGKFALQSGDEVIYEAVVVGPNGESNIINCS